MYEDIFRLKLCIASLLLCLSSVASINPNKNALFYTISKAALDMATKQFALELGPHQIRVNSVCPTLTLTDYVSESPEYIEARRNFVTATPMSRLPSVIEIVRPIMYLLSDQSSMVSGTLHVVDGALMAHMPV